MNDDVVLLVRFLVIGGLYLVLLAVIAVVWRDFASASAQRRGTGNSQAYVIVVEGIAGQFSPGDRLPVSGMASIGRDSDNQIVIDDRTVSGRHAAVLYRDGRWWIQDIGSTNGTWLNEQRVSTLVPIGAGDIIHVGRIALQLAI